MTPDLLENLCFGAVSGGVKFCTLGAASCSFSTHVKKVEVFSNHLYVSTGRNSAFTHHHIPVEDLTRDQITTLLQEQHSQADWVHLLKGFNQTLASLDTVRSSTSGGDGPVAAESILEAVTPGRKRKERYDDKPTAYSIHTPGK